MFKSATHTDPEKRTSAERFYGKYPGFVLPQEPPEPPGGDYSGELWVEVPGILEEDRSSKGSDKKESKKSPRHRPLQVLAKPCFLPGFFFIPEPGAPVWVEFAAGDLECPIWTGAWYPPAGEEPKRTPRTVDGNAPTKFQKLIRTASGQVIQLDDTKDGEGLVITDDKNGNKITMNKAGIKIEDDNDNAITLNDKGIKLETSNSQIVMDSSGVRVSDGTPEKGMQFILVEPLLDWLQKHNHMGNMGAPTPPFLADIGDLTTQREAGIIKSGTGD